MISNTTDATETKIDETGYTAKTTGETLPKDMEDPFETHNRITAKMSKQTIKGLMLKKQKFPKKQVPMRKWTRPIKT